MMVGGGERAYREWAKPWWFPLPDQNSSGGRRHPMNFSAKEKSEGEELTF